MRGPERFGGDMTVPRLVVSDSDGAVTVETETTDRYASKVSVKAKI